MKKILCFLMIFVSFSAGTTFSLASADGYNEAMSDVGSTIKNLNNQVKRIYENLRKNQVKAIVNGFEDKNRILKNIQNLSREDAITNSHQLHEIELKQELNGLLIDGWSVE